MANEEHLARLQQGVAAWNQWREANRNIRPDFSKANLSGVNLSGANFFKANFFMARFIIADLTEAKRIPQALQRIVPDLPSVPVQPVLQASAEEYSMFEHFKRYPWVLETYRYEGLQEVIASLTEKVIAPAELKANELLGPMRR
jgi:hypothetical protein